MIPPTSHSDWSPQWLSVDGRVVDTPPPLGKRTRKTAACGRKQLQASRDEKGAGQIVDRPRKQVSFDGQVRVRFVPSVRTFSARRKAKIYYTREEFQEIREHRLDEAFILTGMQAMPQHSSIRCAISGDGLCIRGIEYEVSTEIRQKKADTKRTAHQSLLDEQAYQRRTGFTNTKYLAEAYSRHTQEAAKEAVLVAKKDANEAKLCYSEFCKNLKMIKR